MSDKVVNDVQGQANNQGLTLYGYWRSSAAYRVRIALNLKGMDYQYVPVHLVKDGGQQHSEGYHQLNPSELVPTLVHDGFVLNQSMAIIEYLESLSSDIPLLPESGELQSKELRWLVKSIAQDISMDIHPLNNLRVLQYLKGELGCTEDQANKWYQHWIVTGFQSIEEKLERLDNIHIKHKLSIKHDHRIKHGQCIKHDQQPDNNSEGKVPAYALGAQPSLIDVCLIPQVYNALRFEVDMSAYPKIMSIYEYANTQPAFISALPENQSDALN